MLVNTSFLYINCHNSTASRVAFLQLYNQTTDNFIHNIEQNHGISV